MAKKGNSGHIKRLNAPKYFAIHRKEHKYTIKPNPGRHSLDKSIALTVLVEKLGLASNRRDADRVIKEGMVSVNGRKVTDPKYPVGLHDLLAVGSERHMVGINNKGQINFRKSEKGAQVYKIVGKYRYRKGLVMLRLHDGTTLGVSADANVDDSVVLSEGKLSKLIKLGSGAKCEVIDGVHVGKTGTVKEISAGSMHRTKSVLVEQQNGTKFETLVKNIIVVE